MKKLLLIENKIDTLQFVISKRKGAVNWILGSSWIRQKAATRKPF